MDTLTTTEELDRLRAQVVGAEDEIDRLRAERRALWHLLTKQTRRVREWHDGYWELHDLWLRLRTAQTSTHSDD